jgi:hypothetical protein
MFVLNHEFAIIRKIARHSKRFGSGCNPEPATNKNPANREVAGSKNLLFLLAFDCLFFLSQQII